MSSTRTSATGEDEMTELPVFVDQQGSTRRLRLQSFIDEYGTDRTPKPISQRLKTYCQKLFEKLTLIHIFNIVLDRIPLLRCLKEYNIRSDLFGDIIAGITVAIMHIPQGMAYGILTTLPPVYGLYVSFFPVLIYMIFGTCPHLSIGTFAVISLMTARAIDGTPLETLTSIEGVANVTDTMIIQEKVGIATTLAFFVGVVQLILSLLQLGFLTVYLSEPFISGFTTGAAIHVFSSQIPSVFGVPSPRNLPTILKLPRFYIRVVQSVIAKINWISTAIAFISMLALYFGKKLNERYKAKLRIAIPCELILVVVGTIVSHFIRLESKYRVAVVGPIKKGLPPPRLPPFTQISYLILPAITIAVVSLCISISLGKMFSRKHGYKVRSNQELLAYGMANVISSFFQCYPNAASLSRSVVQEGSGGKTVLVGGFSCVVLAVVILALTPLFRALPMACLAAIIIINLKGLLFQVKDFLFYYRISLMECIVWLITFITVVLFEVDIGLYVGLGTSFLINTIRTQKPRFVVLGQVGDTEVYKNIKLFAAAREHPFIKILRFDESLYAFNAPFFKRKFYELLGFTLRQRPIIAERTSDAKLDESNKYQYVILDCSPFNFIDTVGVKLLIEIFHDLKKRGIQFYLSECRYDVRCTLDLMDFYGKTGPRIIYVTTHNAVTAARTEMTLNMPASFICTEF